MIELIMDNELEPTRMKIGLRYGLDGNIVVTAEALGEIWDIISFELIDEQLTFRRCGGIESGRNICSDNGYIIETVIDNEKI